MSIQELSVLDYNNDIDGCCFVVYPESVEKLDEVRKTS